MSSPETNSVIEGAEARSLTHAVGEQAATYPSYSPNASAELASFQNASTFVPALQQPPALAT